MYHLTRDIRPGMYTDQYMANRYACICTGFLFLHPHIMSSWHILADSERDVQNWCHPSPVSSHPQYAGLGILGSRTRDCPQAYPPWYMVRLQCCFDCRNVFICPWYLREQLLPCAIKVAMITCSAVQEHHETLKGVEIISRYFLRSMGKTNQSICQLWKHFPYVPTWFLPISRRIWCVAVKHWQCVRLLQTNIGDYMASMYMYQNILRAKPGISGFT